jgi:hypothetical protein
VPHIFFITIGMRRGLNFNTQKYCYNLSLCFNVWKSTVSISKLKIGFVRCKLLVMQEMSGQAYYKEVKNADLRFVR